MNIFILAVKLNMMNMLIVQKYGGTSLGDEGRLLRAARRITALARQGTGVVAVVSAQGNTTDEMIAKAVRVNPRGALGEMDAYLAAGEQMSAALLAELNEPDRPLDRQTCSTSFPCSRNLEK